MHQKAIIIKDTDGAYIAIRKARYDELLPHLHVFVLNPGSGNFEKAVVETADEKQLILLYDDGVQEFHVNADLIFVASDNLVVLTAALVNDILETQSRTNETLKRGHHYNEQHINLQQNVRKLLQALDATMQVETLGEMRLLLELAVTSFTDFLKGSKYKIYKP